jgi:hypothetical protein
MGTKAIDRAPEGRRGAMVLLAAMLVIASTLAGGVLADGAQHDKQKGKLVANAVFKDAGAVNGLLYGKQRGQQRGIIAVLIGLKADQRYALGFSRKGCRKGAGGLARKRIPFTADGNGHAVVTDGTSKTRGRTTAPGANAGANASGDTDGADFLAWRSAVVLTPKTGNKFQRCARVRVATGDVSGDGISDVRAPADASAKSKPKRRLVANAILRPRPGSTLMEDEGLLHFAKQPGRPARIIAVLIGLKAEQPYALGFSREGCRKPPDLLRKRIPLTVGAAGDAVVREGASPKLARRARSVVVLSPGGDGRFVGCGRFDADYSTDGNDL